MYPTWSFQANKGDIPDFVLKKKNNFSVYASCLKFPKDAASYDNATDKAAIVFNRFAHRISNIKVDGLPKLMNSLQCMRAAEYPHLTSLDLIEVEFDNDSLLLLAPQLEHLRLAFMDNDEFDISSVDEKSKCFTKLKTLKLRSTNIDVKTILSKCCNTLEYLELDSLSSLDLTELEFSHLEHLILHFVIEYDRESLKNILSKCCVSLKTLKISFMDVEEIGFCTLLEQTMKITTLELDFDSELEDGIDKFFNKCPLVQNLTLNGCGMEVNRIILKDLTTLKLNRCGAKCITSMLKHFAKYSLKTLELKLSSKVIMECQIPVISTLDKILVHDWAQEKGIKKKPGLDKIMKMFPSNVEVRLIN